MSRAGIVRTLVTEAVSRELRRLRGFAGCHSRLPFPRRVYLDDFEQRSRAALRARDETVIRPTLKSISRRRSPESPHALIEGVLWDSAEVFRGGEN